MVSAGVEVLENQAKNLGANRTSPNPFLLMVDGLNDCMHLARAQG